MHGACYLDDDLLEGQGLDLDSLHKSPPCAPAKPTEVSCNGTAPQALARLGGSEPDLKLPRLSALRGLQ